jgi:hypothetical protein
MSGWSKFQVQAITWYAQREGLKMTMSAYPTVRLTGADGRIVEHNIVFLQEWYKSHLKRLNRQRVAETKRRAAMQTNGEAPA